MYRIYFGSDVIVYVLGVVAAILAILVVRDIDLRQEERNKRIVTAITSLNNPSSGSATGETSA